MPLPPPDALPGLRLYRTHEAAHLRALIQGAMADLSRWLAWCSPSYDLADAHRFIADSHRHARQPLGPFELAITVDDVPVGSLGVHPVTLQPRVVSLGYWIGQEHAGRGLVTKAARQAAAWACRELQAQRVEIVAATHNLPSRHVAERLGARLQPDAARQVTEYGNVVPAVLYQLEPEDIRAWPELPAPDLSR
ncbi:GNAT family N-acetyltransferase [Oleiagrimonas sp. C23AA]|uniref:GNAT family N-acetyltransferase n=1 Tax=Oleiagrimonas sp. C23AA TaxID=2719047 RepID=UPI00141EAF51|nr:GNAT family N-acetyltransferase [Oleiagrimonas sp. C23AA]NII10945.1 GNAT family N-acetyltransferase [Oleiagrimonas sp. C23AA]